MVVGIPSMHWRGWHLILRKSENSCGLAWEPDWSASALGRATRHMTGWWPGRLRKSTPEECHRRWSKLRSHDQDLAASVLLPLTVDRESLASSRDRGSS